MPFSLGQILGGWRRKGDIKKTVPRSTSTSPHGKRPPSLRSDLESQKRSDLFPGGLEEKGDVFSKRSSASPTIKNKSALAWQTIVAPHISEKGGVDGKNYIFKIVSGANKHTIKRAVEERYGVSVNSVRVINMPTKPRRRGQTMGEKPGFKKAIITLREGQNISEF